MQVDILVLRHGQTEWNALGKMQGRKDSPLTAKGRDHARQQGKLLREFGIKGRDIYVSPQGRAMATAQIALEGTALVATPDDRLMEIDVGEWTGCQLADLKQKYKHLFPEGDPLFWYDHAPGGEGYRGLEARCASFLADLKGPSVVIAHGVTSLMLRALALELPLDRIGDLPGGQGVIHRVHNGVHSTLK